MSRKFGLAALLALSIMTAVVAATWAQQKHSGKTTAGAPNKTINVESADATRLEKAITASRGKVTLVNFWATWCSPCVAEFPSLVRLYNRYKPQGLTLISVSIDAESDRTAKVIPFLKKQKATFSAFLKAKGGDAEFINAVDKDWEGSIPRTYVLDRNGNVRKVFTGEIEAAQVDALLQKLLAERPDALPSPSARHPKGLLGQS